MLNRAFWLIGDWRRSEFAQAQAWLKLRGRCREIKSLEAAAAAKKQRLTPSAIVIAQSRPGQFSLDALESLHAAYPTSSHFLLLGPWCEGEHRTVRAATGVTRILWRRWKTALNDALSTNMQTGHQACKVAVWTSSRASYSYLADALAHLQVEPIWLGGSRLQTAAVDAILYDGWEYVLPLPMRPQHTNQARSNRSKAGPYSPHPPRILVQHFPRPDDALAAAAWGIDAILPQPFLLADLATTLNRLLNRK